MAYSGTFKPKYTQKYKGDHTKIVFRSLWELKMMRYLDRHPEIVEWSSEETVVQYFSPIDGKKHRYFPDFMCKKRLQDGTHHTYMIEVKPAKETVAPDPTGVKYRTKTGKPTRRFLNEVKTWGVNSAKWAAAEAYCHGRGWKFLIFTEKELGIK